MPCYYKTFQLQNKGYLTMCIDNIECSCIFAKSVCQIETYVKLNIVYTVEFVTLHFGILYCNRITTEL